MGYLSESFWWLSWNVCMLDPDTSEFLSCLSVCYLAQFLTENKLIQVYLQFWMRYLSEISWRHSQNVFTMNLNKYEFFVCLSVCQLAQFLTEIMSIQGQLQFWNRYLSEYFQTHSLDSPRIFQNDSKIFYTSVSLFLGLLPY